MLTYDTTLQVIARTAQQDLLLDGGLLGRHVLVLLSGGVGTTMEEDEGRRRARRRD